MPTFEKNFCFDDSPFEQYVAENEPNILSYAVVPPYFEVAKKRALTPSSHILFGARGSGKSATRLSTEREIWKRHAEVEEVPLVVPFVNFSRLLDECDPQHVNSDDLLKELAFCVVEALLLWISDQDDDAEVVELLEPDEKNLIVDLTSAFYLSVPEANRHVSQEAAMKILHQNWKNRSSHWANKKWSQVSKIASKALSKLLDQRGDTEDLSTDISVLLSEDGVILSGTAVLSRLVEASRIFGFSGVSVFVDKVDEHPKTQASPQSSAELINPILSHVQLLEVEGLGWQFFLWDRIKDHLRDGPLSVRLDKIAHGEVSWTEDFLKAMITTRVQYFSSNRLSGFSELVEEGIDVDEKLGEILELAANSPREIIRLLDTIAREFDAKYASKSEMIYLSEADLDAGMDKYVSDVIWSIYDKDILSQLLRLDKQKFINKEVQQAFKISAPAATNRIVKWEQCGAVTQSGKREAEGGGGGKPSNEYSLADQRIVRLATRRLYDENALTEAPIITEE